MLPQIHKASLKYLIFYITVNKESWDELIHSVKSLVTGKHFTSIARHGTHLASWPMGTGSSFPLGKVAGAWSCPLIPTAVTVKNVRTLAPPFLHHSMAWCLDMGEHYLLFFIENIDNFKWDVLVRWTTPSWDKELPLVTNQCNCKQNG